MLDRDICEPGEFAGSGEDKGQKVTGTGQALLHYCQHGLLVFHIGRDLYRGHIITVAPNRILSETC